MGYTTLAMADLTIWDVLLRLFAAALCGGVIGIDRGRKRRAAGFRTYMLVCMGAALTMVLSTYLSVMIADIWKLDVTTFKTDVSRFGAQVINGIGFVGAGTILVTGRQQVKGMTTAAGIYVRGEIFDGRLHLYPHQCTGQGLRRGKSFRAGIPLPRVLR